MINWKRLCVMAGILAFLVLLARGCFYACGNTGKRQEAEAPERIELADEPVISVYLHESKQRAAMPLEEYLVGVVAAEMPAGFETEALKAQAVAARTYTLRQIQNGGCSSGCDICTNSKCCQAYDSESDCKKKWGGAYAANAEKITKAVRDTQGEALYYNGTLIEALYHAASGGQTEDSENVFAAAQPYLRGVKSAHEVGSAHLEDKVTLTKKEFVNKVNAAFSKAKLKTSKLEAQVKITELYESGRVKLIKLGGAAVSGRELRGALGLRSALFTIEFSGNSVIIRTKGFGHGVGMSQSGANGMAMDGARYQDILTHYYTGATIRLAS